MAKKRLEVIVELPRKFLDVLKEEMNDELKTAQKKWQVRLSLPERERVFTESFEQLKEKTLIVFGEKWDLSDEVTVLINTFLTRNPILLKENEPPKEKIYFIRKSGGWETTTEVFPERVSIQEFREQIIYLLKHWSRTAVFYGVGSYV